MINWSPRKKDILRIEKMHLLVAVSENSERVIIGPLAESQQTMQGSISNMLLLDQIRPFGTYLLDLPYDYKDEWNTALSYLQEAHEIMQEWDFERFFTGSSPLELEKKAQMILQNKYDSGDPFCLYTALKIWYGYWKIRDSKKDKEFEIFINQMQNMVRPFLFRKYEQPLNVLIKQSDPILKISKPMYQCDGLTWVYRISPNNSEDYIVLQDSLLPLNEYYRQKLLKWPKAVVECKICGKKFMVRSLHHSLCSDACKKMAQQETIKRLRADPKRNKVDTLLRNADERWNYRWRTIRKAPSWTKADVESFEIARNKYKKEKTIKRKQLKAGEITFAELENWTFAQLRELDRQIDVHDSEKNDIRL